jgi:hypothetical protein
LRYGFLKNDILWSEGQRSRPSLHKYLLSTVKAEMAFDFEKAMYIEAEN